MHVTHQQEEFSRAFVHAVSSAAGFKVQPGATPDDDSIDLTVCSRTSHGAIRSPKVDVQLKCWMAETPAEDFAFWLNLKNYEDLRVDRSALQVPRILVVVVVPRAIQDWAAQTDDALILRHVAHWTCLHGAAATANTTGVTVTVPRANRFTTESLPAMMGRVGQGAAP